MKIIFKDNKCEFDFDNDSQIESNKNLTETQIKSILEFFATDLCSLSCYQDNIGTVKNFLQILKNACSLKRFESDGSVNEDSRNVINNFYSKNISRYLESAKDQRMRLFGFCTQNPIVFANCRIGQLGNKIGASQFEEVQNILGNELDKMIKCIESSPDLAAKSGQFFHDFENNNATSSSTSPSNFTSLVLSKRDRD